MQTHEMFSFTFIVRQKGGYNAIALLLGDSAQVGSFGQILADEAIRVLVGAAFPGMVWRRKIDLGVQDAFQFPVIMKLGPIVRRDGLTWSRSARSSLTVRFSISSLVAR